MNEYERLEYTKKEFETLIEETKMQINVAKKNYVGNLEDMLKVTNALEHKINKLEVGINKPYFARIDFRNATDLREDICYIGKIGVMNNDNEIITVDWRAPISSLYYDSNIGPCSYLAPEGNIKGDLLLKRQYDIEKGILQSYHDVDIVSSDEFLNPYLSVSADKRLKNIVSTIQTEQNKIIRETIHKNLIVQGVAGSGKTTVALHRIAYLVYNYREQFENKQYMIIGPNKFFINYISNVLPDLDVDDVNQFDFLEFVNDYLEEEIKITNQMDSETTKIKTSLYYKNIIEKYVEELDEQVVPQEDLQMYGFKILSSATIKNVYDSIMISNADILTKVNKCITLLEKKLEKKREQILVNAHKFMMNLYENETEEKKRKKLIEDNANLKKELNGNCHNLLKKYFNVVNNSILKLYTYLLQNIEKYDANGLLKSTNLKNPTIQYEDLIALVYLKYRVLGNSRYHQFRHIVIDEAQDYNEFIFYTLRKICKNATFSIFGDLAQSIFPYRGIENWEILKQYDKKFEIVYLTKSYRTTIEIMLEANKITKHLLLNEAQPVIRHGESVKYVQVKDATAILNQINEFIDKNYNSIAIISKDEKASNAMFSNLKNHIDLTNVTSQSQDYVGGICCITSSLCKGLEFDAVIINDVDEENFNSSNPLEMKLLYVSMTRALHELVIMYKKECSKVLKMN